MTLPAAAGGLPPSAQGPLDHAAEARLFWRLRWRTARTTLRQLLATARLRLVVALMLTAVFWVALFLLCYEGFQFLSKEVGHASTYAGTIRAVYNLFYASLMVMLVFSSGILLYGGLYRAEEAAFLITTPASSGRIFVHKLQESVLFSSWGFLLLGSPMLVAYGIAAEAPWYYYAMLVPYLIAFVYVPASLGAICCLLVIYFFSRLRLYLAVAAAGLLIAATIWAGWSLVAGQESDLLTQYWFQELFARISSVENRLLPSWWLSSGLLKAARNDTDSLDYQPWSQAVLFLGLLVANALLLHQLAVGLAARMYRESYSRLHGGRSGRRRRAIAWIDRLVLRLIFFVPRPIRLLIVNDLRVFRRDPMQWTQVLIFVGLVGLYFLNVRRLTYDERYVAWIHVVSFLNLAVVGLILSTFTTRFVFPMISLEGRRFWILGLLPVGRDTILWGKFLFASIGSLLPCCLLIFISDLGLGVWPLVSIVQQVTCVLLCVGLAGISVGMGAMMPDLRETNPSRIAAGFGGTLNLVLSTLFILVVVALTAVPSQFYVVASQPGSSLNLSTVRLALGLGIAAAVVISAVATAVPMRLGLRAFRRLEF